MSPASLTCAAPITLPLNQTAHAQNKKYSPILYTNWHTKLCLSNAVNRFFSANKGLYFVRVLYREILFLFTSKWTKVRLVAGLPRTREGMWKLELPLPSSPLPHYEILRRALHTCNWNCTAYFMHIKTNKYFVGLLHGFQKASSEHSRRRSCLFEPRVDYRLPLNLLRGQLQRILNTVDWTLLCSDRQLRATMSGQ